MTLAFYPEMHLLPHGEGLPLPAYQHPGDSGLDLRAALPEKSPLILPPGTRALVPCGFRMALPIRATALVCSRSGLALSHGVMVLNAPGIIDSNYRGEVGVILANGGTEDFVVRRGDRIAQLVLIETPEVRWQVVAELPETCRQGGFGSSGQQ